jgi:cholesterol 7-dehydrogenase
MKLTSECAASICYFRFETELGEILLFHTHTPLEPLLQKVEFRYWADKSIPRLCTAHARAHTGEL